MHRGIIVVSALLILVIVALASVVVAAVILRGRHRRQRGRTKADGSAVPPLPDAWSEAGRRAVPETDAGPGTRNGGDS